MIDVLFGQAYFLRFDPKLWEAHQPYAPLGTLYAAASVRQRGYSVGLFDAMLAESEADWTVSLALHRPRFAVIYEDSFNYLSKMCLLRMREAAMTMIAAARSRGAEVIVAGSDASDHPALYLDGGADLVVSGEGEITLVEALDTLSRRSDRPLATIPGLCLRTPDGHLLRTPARPIVRDLDTMPDPAWDLIDVEKYRRMWMARHGYFSMNIVTTRGCPYHCNWCAKPIYGQRYTTRTPQHVAAEVESLSATYGPDHLWFADDIFGLKPGWIEAFASIVAERGSVVPFKCLMRADGVTDATARALDTAGCRTVWIGAESGSQRVLDWMEKGTRIDQIETATRRLHAAGIDVGFFLQFGYPGETFDDIQLTLDMVRRCRPDDIGVSVSYPLPGTTFYERVKADLGEKQNWVDSGDLAMMYHATYSPDFYRALHGLVHAEFRQRRARDLLSALARRPHLIRPKTAREVVAGMLQAAKRPALERKVKALARELPGGASARRTPTLIPMLSQQAAAVPSEQPR
jgi:anaerobic magnesium-protoporphyrin IX monomethyl ester cyclase